MSDIPSNLWISTEACPDGDVWGIPDAPTQMAHKYEKYIRASELAKAYEAIRDLAASAEHHGYAVYPMEKHAAIIKTAREQGK